MNNQQTSTLHLSDTDHPKVRAILDRLICSGMNDDQKFDVLFNFTKNEIPFGFPPTWDYIKASETIEYGIGYCNSKAILMYALCKGAEIPVKIRAGKINTRIMRHIFPAWAFPFLPDTADHMWIRVKLEDRWIETDAYIIDNALFLASRDLSMKNGNDLGYGLGRVSPDSHGWWDEGFIQTNALVEDNGIWDDAETYYRSDHYRPLPWFQKLTLPLVLKLSNRKIEKYRNFGLALLKKVEAEKAHQKQKVENVADALAK